MYPIRLPTVLIRDIVCPIEMKTSCYPSLSYWIAQMPSLVCRDCFTSCCSTPRRVVSGAWGCFPHRLRPQLWIVILFSPPNPPVLTPFIQINWSGLRNREDWHMRRIYEIAWRIRNSKINPFWTCREKNLRMVLPPALSSLHIYGLNQALTRVSLSREKSRVEREFSLSILKIW